MTASNDFRLAHASGTDWRTASRRCAAQLDPIPDSAKVGFVYVTDDLAENFAAIIAFFRSATVVADWVGTTGMGICATGTEYFDEPAIAVLLGSFPEGSYRLFESRGDEVGWEPVRFRDDPGTAVSGFGIVHCAPDEQRAPELLVHLALTNNSFLVGGTTSARWSQPQVAGRVINGGISGILFSEHVPVATALTQGCTPIGPPHRITCCEDQVVVTLDDPALDVLGDDLGETGRADFQRAASTLLPALIVDGSDREDYTVCHFLGIDVRRRFFAIGGPIEQGQRMFFCRRDAKAAHADLVRMLGEVKRRSGGNARAALYFSCLARGPNTFGPNSEELRTIKREIGDIPLVGFYAGGEISHDRFYAYTGVLSLFL